MTADEKAIRALIGAFAQALHDKDADRAIATLTSDATSYDLAPPLAIGPEGLHDASQMQKWFATWKGPIVSQDDGMTVAVGGDIGHAWCLRHMTGTKTDGEAVSLWFRATACFRRTSKGWRITHMHNSVPFAMDGSGRALLDLEP